LLPTISILLLTACVDNSVTAKSNSDKISDIEDTLAAAFKTQDYYSDTAVKAKEVKTESDIQYTLAAAFKTQEVKAEETKNDISNKPHNTSIKTQEVKVEKVKETKVKNPKNDVSNKPYDTSIKTQEVKEVKIKKTKNDIKHTLAAVFNKPNKTATKTQELKVAKTKSPPAKNTTLSTTAINKSDKVKPIIALVGATTIALTVGDTYTDKGAKATDNADGDITHKLWKKGTVNTEKAGEYTITWVVADNSGNKAKVYRKVMVSPVRKKEKTPKKVEVKVALDIYNIREFGAACDGKTDDTEALQQAIDEGSKNRETVVVPKGCHALLKSNIKLRDHTSLLIEEGAIVTTKSRLTGMYVQHIDININGELRQPEYVKTHNADGSISKDYWLLRGTSGRFGTNPLYPSYARSGEPSGYYGMKAFNCTGEGTNNLKCDHSKGTNSVGWGKSDRGIIEILANEYKSSNDKYELDHFPGQFDADYGHYKIHSSKKTGKITGPWKKSDLNPLSQKHYGKNYDALKYDKQAIINRTFMGTLQGMGTKGIALLKVRNAEVTGLTISGFAAETIYALGPRGNVKFTHNKILNANATGLNFNGASRCDDCEISYNEVYDAHGGIEASVGDVTNNKLVRCHLALQTGGLWGQDNTKFNDNIIIDATVRPVYITYGKKANQQYTGIEFKRNKVIGAYQTALNFQNIAGLIMEDNIIEDFGERRGGRAIDFIRNVTGVMRNNTLRKAKMYDRHNQNKALIIEGANVNVTQENTQCIKWDKSGDRSCQ